MKYTKPYLWSSTFRTYKHMMDYRWRERKTDSLTFSYGQKLPFDSGNPNLAFTMCNPKDYDLIFHSEVEPEIFKQYDNLSNNCMSALLVNQKVKNILLELCPDDVQFFKAVIVPEDPKKINFENHDYEVLNITRLVDAYDLDLSEYTPYSDIRITDVKKVVLKKEMSPHIHIARQYNDPMTVIASPELVKRFKREKVTGVKFLKDFEYKG